MSKILLTCWMLCLVSVPAIAEKQNNGAVAKSLEEYVRQARASQAPLQTAEGSLYSDAGLNSYLFTDLKARRVNDILTIRVLENTTASSGADTNATRKSSKAWRYRISLAWRATPEAFHSPTWFQPPATQPLPARVPPTGREV